MKKIILALVLVFLWNMNSVHAQEIAKNSLSLNTKEAMDSIENLANTLQPDLQQFGNGLIEKTYNKPLICKILGQYAKEFLTFKEDSTFERVNVYIRNLKIGAQNDIDKCMSLGDNLLKLRVLQYPFTMAAILEAATVKMISESSPVQKESLEKQLQANLDVTDITMNRKAE